MSRMAGIIRGLTTGDPRAEEPAAPSRAEDQSAAPRPSLKALAIRGSIWTLLSQFVSKAIGFVSLPILTYLLEPEAFGLMVIVNAVVQGLQMFSDVGIGPNVIQHERGDDRAFLNTAWTIQAVRGLCLWIAACILTWPIAKIYGNDMYLALIPVAALTAVLGGFMNTSQATLNRHLMLGPHAVFELGSQVVGVGATIAIAYVTRSVWALVFGALAATATQVILSHTLLAWVAVKRSFVPSARNFFRWDRSAAHELIRFGRWIFISTALTFLVTRGDRFVLAAFLGEGLLGFYYIASRAVSIGRDPIGRLTNRVLFPVYAKIVKDGVEHLRPRMRKARITLLWATLPFFCVLMVWGQDIVDLLLHPRYGDVGWIVRVLAAGAVFSTISRTCSPVLLAAGDSYRHMIVLATRGMMLLALMIVGGVWFGTEGLIVGIAATSLLNYPVLAWAVHRHGAWMPRIDLAAVLGCVAFVSLGLALTELTQVFYE